MGVRVLGRPALVGASDETTEIRGARQTGLLALLVTHRGRTVRNELLFEELWGCRPGGAQLRVTVKRLRDRFQAVTGTDPIVNRAGGYVLELDDDAVDESRFAKLVDHARIDRSAQSRVELLRQADALWDGQAFEGTSDLPSIQPEHIRLENLRDDARELLAASLIALDGNSEAIQVLRTVIARDPFREPAWTLRIVALYRSFRQQEALATYEQIRRLLADEVGIQPGQALKELHRQMLDQLPAEQVGLQLLHPTAHRTDRIGRAGRETSSNAADALRTARPYVDRRSDPTKRRGRFVGRAELLAEADRFVAGDLDTTAFVVEGPAGIGKTSFGREVAAAAGRSGLSVSWGSCPRDTTASMVVVHQILSALTLQVDREGGVDEALAVLGSAFPDLRVSGNRTADDASPVGSDLEKADDTKARIYGAAERLLRATPSPHIAVIDDAQWISRSSAELIAYVAGAVPGVRWLILARDTNRHPGFDLLLAGLARGEAMWHDLGPLSDAEVDDLVVDHIPDAPDDVRALVADRSGGHPFLATELARHLVAGGDPASTPRTVEAVIGAELFGLDEAAAALCSTISIAEAPLPPEVLVDAAGIAAADGQRAIQTVLASGLASADRDRTLMWPSHDLVRGAVAARIDGTATRRIHQALADALRGRDHEFGPQLLGHLLASGASDDPSDLDAVAATVIASLNAQVSAPEAVQVGATYLAATGPLPETRQGIEARLHLAASHFAIGEVSKGEQIIAGIGPQLQALDDPALLADALFTRSAFTASAIEAGAWADEGLELLGRLPSDEHRRRALLACWSGHLCIRAIRPAEANHAALLAETVEGASPDPTIRLHILMLRFHIALTVDADPKQPDLLIDELQHLASTSSEPAAAAAVGLARLDRCLRTETLDDYERAIQSLADLPSASYHADLRWSVAAGVASLDLARGDLDAASTTYLRALQIGGELSVRTAFGASLLHRMLLDWERGTLRNFYTLLPTDPSAEDPVLLAAHGLVALEAGDVATAERAADLLAARPDVLVEAGASGWQVVASVGALVAWRTGHEELANNLGKHLNAHAGYGLSMNGLAYLGAADRAIGLIAGSTGDLDGAMFHLRRAREADERRGAPRWAARAALEAAEVLEHRDGAGDRDEAAALRVDAAQLTTIPPSA